MLRKHLLLIVWGVTATAPACDLLLGPADACPKGLVPNDVLQACVTLPPCEGGVVNERNECVRSQEEEFGGSGGDSDRAAPYVAGRSGAGGRQAGAGGAGRSGRAGAGGASGGSAGVSGRAGTSGGAAAAGERAGGGSSAGASGAGSAAAGEHAGGGGRAGTGGAVCGNGTREGDEICDGNCPTSCGVPASACVLEVLGGSAASCDAQCTVHEIKDCKSGDGCCPLGCTRATDADCSPSCGDGVVTGAEKCEPNSVAHPCPTAAECDDHDVCTDDMLLGSAEKCSSECVHQSITPKMISCADSDPCTDDTPRLSVTSCSYECPHTRQQPTAASCADSDPCTDDTPRLSASSCRYECPWSPVPTGTDCGGGRMCTTTGQCKAPDPVCGNGKVEPPEECEPSAAGSTPFSCSKLCRRQTVYTPCKSDKDCVNGTVCGLEMCTRACDGIEDCDYISEYPNLQLWCPQPLGTQCVIRCASDAECPPGTSCNGGGYCQGPER